MAHETYAKRRWRKIFLLCGGKSAVVSPKDDIFSDARVSPGTSSEFKLTLRARIGSVFREIWSHIKKCNCLKQQTEVIEISIGGCQPHLSDPTLSILAEENMDNVPCQRIDEERHIENMEASKFMEELRKLSSDSSSQASTASSEDSLQRIENVAGSDTNVSSTENTVSTDIPSEASQVSEFDQSSPELSAPEIVSKSNRDIFYITDMKEEKEVYERISICDCLAPQFSNTEIDQLELNMADGTSHTESDLEWDCSSTDSLQWI